MPVHSPSKIMPDWVTDPSVMDSPVQRTIGGIARFMGLDKPETNLPTPNAIVGPATAGVAVAEPTKRVAPKRAANALVDLLMGRSPHSTPPKVLSEEEASRIALLTSRVGARPEPPTTLQMSNPMFKPMTRVLSRDPIVKEAFIAKQKTAGLPLNVSKVVSVGYPEYRARVTNNLSGMPSRQSTDFATNSKLVKTIGKTKQEAAEVTGQKIYTGREIRSMLDGPAKAFKAGLIDKAEMDRLLKENQLKIKLSQESLQNMANTKEKLEMMRRIQAKQQSVVNGDK